MPVGSPAPPAALLVRLKKLLDKRPVLSPRTTPIRLPRLQCALVDTEDAREPLARKAKLSSGGHDPLPERLRSRVRVVPQKGHDRRQMRY